VAPKNKQKSPSLKVTAAPPKTTVKLLRSGKKSSIPKKDPFSARTLLSRGRLFWKDQLQHSGKTIRRVKVKVEKALAPSGAWAQTTLARLRQGIWSRTRIPSSSIIIQQRRREASLLRPAPRKIIRLQGDEEHRCPYCLETVEDNDPRGVKICPICGTYHHADCWTITGVCQVPHQHE
jgi:ribosomal protein L37AE/L43A